MFEEKKASCGALNVISKTLITSKMSSNMSSNASKAEMQSKIPFRTPILTPREQVKAATAKKPNRRVSILIAPSGSNHKKQSMLDDSQMRQGYSTARPSEIG